MPFVEWKAEFSLGIPSVDYEHEELIALLNEVHEGLDEGHAPETMSAFLGEVHARISAHFALEEKIMRKVGYENFDVHKADHETLLDQIRDIMDAYEAGEFENLDEQLSSALEAWFTTHFRTHDARLHDSLGDSYPGVEEI
jgi:hemerythrin